MPILLRLGAQLDFQFGSEVLLQELSKLGFCVSYDEITRFKHSTVLAQSSDGRRCDTSIRGGKFTQYVGDNVDHSVRTIGDKNTFHGMGVISVTIAEGNFSDEWSLCTSFIPRTNSRIDVGDVTKHVGIPLMMHNKKSRSGLSSLLLKDITSLSSPTLIPSAVNLNLNLLWHMYGLLDKPEHPRPSWSGFMQTVLCWCACSSHGTDVSANYRCGDHRRVMHVEHCCLFKSKRRGVTVHSAYHL